ncbi:MAG: acyl-CoA reductase [Candidatus Binatia bacterium]
MNVRSYRLPGLAEPTVVTVRHACGAAAVELPQLTPAQLRSAIDRATRAVNQGRPRSVGGLLATLDRVIGNWLRPDYHLRQLAEQVLPEATGFSPTTVRHGLPLLLAPLRGEALGALLDHELGNRLVLDRWHRGRRAVGPSLITHILPGNIPGLAAAPILLSLAVKSAVLVKPAAGDPIFPVLFAASIREVDDELAQRLIVACWRGGDEALERVAFTQSDVVVAGGSDGAIAAIAARVPGRFIGHGHKVSFAAIGKERLSDRAAGRALARRLAYDVSLWDQQGCLSPQLCYVESNGVVTPAEFGDLLAQALSYYARLFPPKRLTFDEQVQVLRFRQDAEWRRVQGDPVKILASPHSACWTVSVEHDPDFKPTCLNRCIRLKAVPSLSELQPALAAHRPHLEAAGLAVSSNRLVDLTEMFGGCGVHRICPLGSMQTPMLSWRQGGRPRVADWVEWLVREEQQGAKVPCGA